MINLDHHVSDIEIKGKNYKYVIPNSLKKIFKKNKTSINFVCLLILHKNCKFYNKDHKDYGVNLEDYMHIIEVPVNKFEKIEINVYTLQVMNNECFTFELPKKFEE